MLIHFARNDFEWMEKTGLNVYAHEAWWLKTITNDADFPYIKMIIASDGTLEIRYDENAKDDTSKDTIRTKEDFRRRFSVEKRRSAWVNG